MVVLTMLHRPFEGSGHNGVKTDGRVRDYVILNALLTFLFDLASNTNKKGQSTRNAEYLEIP
jgi:hypothetical protein